LAFQKAVGRNVAWASSLYGAITLLGNLRQHPVLSDFCGFF
jgi:hypothetical protein